MKPPFCHRAVFAPDIRMYSLVFFLCLLLAAGCASKQESPPPTTRPVAEHLDIKAQSASPPPLAARKSSEKQPSPAPGTPPRTSPKGTGPEQRRATTGIESPVTRMLESAGRGSSLADQPEAGFMLKVPAAIGDGEAFLVEFGAKEAQRVSFTWQEKTLELTSPSPATGTFQALLPVALDEKNRTLPLSMTVHWADGTRERFKAELLVKKRQYPVQKLKVESKYVSPPPEMKEKIQRDRLEMRAAINTVSPRQYWSLPMLRPVPGEVTSLYGLRRVFNGVPKSPHKGLDLDAKEGDPILAADDGTVVLVSDHYYGGNTVVVDHGLGVLTAYLHLSGFNSSVGQKVKRGDVIGYIGSTGRVTGPHLHLSLYVMGESVNANACLEK